MRMDVPATESWYAVSNQIRAALSFHDPALHVHAYAGFQHALFEVTQGLAKLYSHKKTIAVIEPSEPALQQITVDFSQDSFTVVSLSRSDLLDPMVKLRPVLGDLLFVLVSEDDPVTGRLHNLAPLDAALIDQRVFRVKLSHADFRTQTVLRPASFEARILSFAPAFAVVVGGERVRIQPQLAPRLHWQLATWNDQVLPTNVGVTPNTQLIEGFEQLISTRALAGESQFRTYFNAGESRVFDRAVLIAKGLDGSAVIDALAQSLRLGLPSVGVDSPLDTTSPCRWNTPRFLDWLLLCGESEETIRGLIAIDVDTLRQFSPEKIHHALLAVANDIEKIQKG